MEAPHPHHEANERIQILDSRSAVTTAETCSSFEYVRIAIATCTEPRLARFQCDSTGDVVCVKFKRHMDEENNALQ